MHNATLLHLRTLRNCIYWATVAPASVTCACADEPFVVHVAPPLGASRARTDLGHLREWLGTSPRTGRLHLPPAAASRTYEQTGVKTYQVEDVLVDVDLFRRLRARGEARGAQGIEDLTTALRLVEGLPFDYLRERGWSWLLDGDRRHETIGCSIVDTAHIVVLDALSKSDLATARNAAETACRAAPYDDICRLDLVKVAATEGHDDAADQMLTDDVFNRTDDQLETARTGFLSSRPLKVRRAVV